MTVGKTIGRRLFARIVKASPVLASEILYFKVFRRRLNLKAPRTFNEKLMWLKLNEPDALKTQCTDKYLVREYVRARCGEELLIDLHGVYDRAEDIDFAQLPNRFVLKCTHGSAFNIVCKNKLFLDEEYTRRQLHDWLKMDYSLYCGEPHYAGIKPRIVAERYIGKRSGQLPIDYKIHCFHGEPQFIDVVIDRDTPLKKNLTYTCDWELLPYTHDSVQFDGDCERPVKLAKMIDIARKLSRAFMYVRVDLYTVGVRIYFGELTFTPAACVDTDLLARADLELGQLLHIEQLALAEVTR